MPSASLMIGQMIVSTMLNYQWLMLVSGLKLVMLTNKEADILVI
jgi:hypothetical protein